MSSSLKLWATLLLRAVTGPAVSMVRNSYNTTQVDALVFFFLGLIRMGQKHERYLKVYLVGLLFFLWMNWNIQVCPRRCRNHIHYLFTHIKRFRRTQNWCTFYIAHLSLALASRWHKCPLSHTEVCCFRWLMHRHFLLILFSF